MNWRWMVILVLSIGCTKAKKKPPPPDAGPKLRIEVELAWKRGLPMLTNVAPMPDGYAELRTGYRTATTALARYDVDAASKQFATIAEKLHLPEGHPHRETYEAARCMIFQNIGAIDRAVLASGEPTPERTLAARKRLESLQAKDPACAASIAYTLERIRAGTTRHD